MTGRRQNSIRRSGAYGAGVPVPVRPHHHADRLLLQRAAPAPPCGRAFPWTGIESCFQDRLIMNSVLHHPAGVACWPPSSPPWRAPSPPSASTPCAGGCADHRLMTVNNIPMMNADIVTGVSLCLLFVAFFDGWGAFAGWVNSWQSAVVLPERLTMGFGTLLIAHIMLQHSLCHPVRGAQAAADGPEPRGRGPGPGLHLDAGLLEGGAARRSSPASSPAR